MKTQLSTHTLTYFRRKLTRLNNDCMQMRQEEDLLPQDRGVTNTLTEQYANEYKLFIITPDLDYVSHDGKDLSTKEAQDIVKNFVDDVSADLYAFVKKSDK